MRYVLVACVAILVGLGIGWTARSALRGPVEPPATVQVESSRSPEVAQVPPEDSVRSPESSSSEPSPRDRAEAGLISPELQRYARDEIAAGWSEKRKDAIPGSLRDVGLQQFEKVVRTAPREIGRELAGHQDTVDALGSSDLVSILRSLDKEDFGPQLEMVRDASRFHSFFQCSGGATVDGAATLRGEKELQLDAQTTLTFGPGVHAFYQNWMMRLKTLPNCITLSGAGMDQTLLVMGSLSVGDVVDRFTIRDCTVYTNGWYLFDLRSRPAVLALDRVRFCGFDSGAGGSCLLGTEATAVLATDCRFEGGYGRTPTSGTLFDVRTNALLARFERCSFSRMSLEPEHLRPGATVIFTRCSFENLFDRESTIRNARAGIVFDACSMTFADASQQSLPGLNLNDLFPDWRARGFR